MAQFDLWQRGDGPGFWLDCQTDLMEHFDTRLVVPLLPLADAPEPARRLNPVFEIGGEAHMMATQYAGTIPLDELRDRAGSLADHRYDILNAINFLISGI